MENATIAGLTVYDCSPLQLGIKLTKHWSRAVPGHTGEKLGIYRLDQEHWCQLDTVLARRAAKRERLQPQAEASPGSPAPLTEVQSTGDPMPSLDAGLTPESLAKGQNLVEAAAIAPAFRRGAVARAGATHCFGAIASGGAAIFPA